MTPSERNSRKRRLEAAGFKALPTGWVPAAYAATVQAQVDAWAGDVAKAADIAPKRGRPRKTQNGVG